MPIVASGYLQECNFPYLFDEKNTYTLAYEACEKLFSESGQIPTIELIKQLINVNSPNTISCAIKDWKKNLPQAVKTSFNHAELPAFLFDAITTIWQQALLHAHNTYLAQAEEIQAMQASLANKELELFDERIRVEHLSQLAGQKYLDEIIQLKTEIHNLLTEAATHAGEMENYQSLVSDYIKNNALLTEQLNQEREKFSRLESQYNKEHDWSLKRIEEEKNIYRQNSQLEMERLKAESARNKQNKELAQAKLIAANKQIDALKQRIRELT